MWIAVGVALVVFTALAVASRFMTRADTPAETPPEAPPENPYERLRAQALTVDAAKVGIEPVEGRAWGVVMDLHVGDATATVVSFADGTASIYLSNGGGFIGGHQHERIRVAATTFVDAATAALSMMRPSTAHPLPTEGYVTFYARTASITLAAEADEQKLQSAPSGPLAALFAAGHGVIAEYRQVAPAP
jgi:hypothetical protein